MEVSETRGTLLGSCFEEILLVGDLSWGFPIFLKSKIWMQGLTCAFRGLGFRV